MDTVPGLVVTLGVALSQPVALGTCAVEEQEDRKPH